nr:hypothetical protein JVH1_0234 [Rhodococcus sp. JVH1]
MPDAAVGEMHGRIRYCPKASISMRIRSRWEPSDRRGQAAGGSGLSRGFAVRGHAAARASDTPIRPVHSSSRQAHRSSAPRAPADRIGDQCQGHGDGCTATRRAPHLFPRAACGRSTVTATST